MMMPAGLRKFTFAAHITSSVGWVGAVIVFLALAVVALTSQSEMTVRGAYLVMAPAAWFVLVPLAHASLISGVALSLGTTWGLVRHYWVVLKLGITVFCTAILLIYMGTFRQMASIAADPTMDLQHVRNASPLLHAVLALMLLLAATWLGVYKPFGVTPYGSRRMGERLSKSNLSSAAFSRSGGPRTAPTERVAPGRKELYLLVGIAGLLLLFLILHIISGGVGGHQ